MPNLFNEDFSASIKSKLLPVKMSADIAIEVEGLLVKATLTQTFTNTSDEPIEAIHAIPVPSDSTLVDFKVHKNNETWQGTVMERSKANHAFEESIENGDSAFQLKRSKEDLFTLVLGNLLSKETLRIELELAFPMQWIAGQGQLYLPLVMGERYGKSNLLPEENPESSFLAEYPLNLTLTLKGALTSALVESPSHPLKEGSLPNQYTLLGDGLLDRDLKINFSNITKMTTELTVNKVGDEYLGLLNVITSVSSSEIAEPRDVLFVLDCSGSMEGQSMTQLKKVMRNLLDEMRPQDRFNLYPYGSTVESVFDEAQPVSEDSILQAKRYVRRHLDANLGGTETAEALLTALLSYQKSQPIDIVLVTDGQIWMDQDENQFKLLKAYANQENVRIFPVGVGHATTESSVKQLAEMSNGSYVLTNPNEDISFTVQAHFKRLFHAPLSVDLNTDTVWNQIPTAYQGDAIQIPVWFKESPGLVEFEVKSNGDSESYKITPTNEEKIGLQKWVAYQRYQGQSLSYKDKVEFAVKHQLLTDETDYLIQLERQESEKSDQLPSLVKMPQMAVHEHNVPYLDIPMFSRKEMPDREIMSSSIEDENSGLSYLEIPDFLKRDSGDEEAESKQSIFMKLEQKQIKGLSEYLNQVISGNLTFKVKELYSLEVPDDLIAAIRLSILMTDEAATIQVLLQLSENETGWEVIDRKLNSITVKLLS